MDEQMKELMPESLYLRRNDPEAETSHQRMAAR
jgi:hypothetical protein